LSGGNAFKSLHVKFYAAADILLFFANHKIVGVEQLATVGKGKAMVQQRFLTVEEVAKITRSHPNTVRWWIHTGKLRATRFGRRWLIEPESLWLSGKRIKFPKGTKP
jgi:excisionase family DNA binding protein